MDIADAMRAHGIEEEKIAAILSEPIEVFVVEKVTAMFGLEFDVITLSEGDAMLMQANADYLNTYYNAVSERSNGDEDEYLYMYSSHVTAYTQKRRVTRPDGEMQVWSCTVSDDVVSVKALGRDTSYRLGTLIEQAEGIFNVKVLATSAAGAQDEARNLVLEHKFLNDLFDADEVDDLGHEHDFDDELFLDDEECVFID